MMIQVIVIHISFYFDFVAVLVLIYLFEALPGFNVYINPDEDIYNMFSSSRNWDFWLNFKFLRTIFMVYQFTWY